MRIGRLHIITDTAIQDRWSAQDLAARALEAGADVIQFRDKAATTHAALQQAMAIAESCRRKRAQFIVNDRADIAWAADASGVHLGDDDLPLELGRRLLGPDRILGASADNADDVRARASQGADYVGVGPVFSTSSKRDTGPVLGLEGLARAVQASSIPVIAIGGIDATNLAEVLATGVHGVAVLSAVCCADDPREATEQLAHILNEASSVSRK